jgi:hypothetical protein
MLWATALWLRRLHGAYMHSRNANVNAIFISNVISDLRRTQTRCNDQRRWYELRHEWTFNAYFIVIDIFASLQSASKELSPAKSEGLFSQHALSKVAQRSELSLQYGTMECLSWSISSYGYELWAYRLSVLLPLNECVDAILEIVIEYYNIQPWIFPAIPVAPVPPHYTVLYGTRLRSCYTAGIASNKLQSSALIRSACVSKTWTQWRWKN